MEWASRGAGPRQGKLERSLATRLDAPTVDLIGWPESSRVPPSPLAGPWAIGSWVSDPRAHRLAVAGLDWLLSPLVLAVAGAPLPLHPQLQQLWPGGHRAPWGLARRLVDLAATTALPPLHPLWLRSGAGLMLDCGS
jgi:hypothetical protein